MSAHDTLNEEAREQAALYVMNALGVGARTSYEAHLQMCRICRSEVETMRGIVDQLALFAPAAEPPVDTRERPFDRVHRPLGVERPDRRSPFTFVRAEEGCWEPTEIAGVEVRVLFTDEEHDRVTKLVRMVPGASYPAHRHGGPEECYVLSGDLLAGDLALRPGDYQRAEERTVHSVQSTREGCLLLIVGSTCDELMGGATT